MKDIPFKCEHCGFEMSYTNDQSKPPEEPSEHQHKEPVFGPSEHNPPYPKPMFSKSKEPSGEGSNLMIGEMAADYVDEIVGTSSYDYAPGWHFGKGLRKGLSTPPPAPTEEITEMIEYAKHTHVNKNTVGQNPYGADDQCVKCGYDLRHPIHKPL